jgi:hypothetical protein
MWVMIDLTTTWWTAAERDSTVSPCSELLIVAIRIGSSEIHKGRRTGSNDTASRG